MKKEFFVLVVPVDALLVLDSFGAREPLICSLNLGINTFCVQANYNINNPDGGAWS